MSKEPIRKEPSGRYVAVVDVAPPGEKRKQLRRRFDTYREARAWVAATRAEVAAGRYVAPTKITVGEHLTEWLAGRRDLKPGTRANYTDAVKVATTAFGAKQLHQLTKADVDRMVAGMLDGSLRRRGRTGESR